MCQKGAKLEIFRLLKFEDVITMVRSHVGSATPPSVMVLFWSGHVQRVSEGYLSALYEIL